MGDVISGRSPTPTTPNNINNKTKLNAPIKYSTIAGSHKPPLLLDEPWVVLVLLPRLSVLLLVLFISSNTRGELGYTSSVAVVSVAEASMAIVSTPMIMDPMYH